MTKSELIAMYAKARDRKKKDAEADVCFIFDAIRDALAEGDKVVLTGFGTFDVRDRAEKRCLNPRTREPIQLPSGKAPAFKAGRGLKEAVNPKKEAEAPKKVAAAATAAAKPAKKKSKKK
ncbi:MAG: HU family DNA-binding protein [Oscillospiraceae bacterium]|nr:HU family DNA-binding protein [Oscillospiraceae bacterium]